MSRDSREDNTTNSLTFLEGDFDIRRLEGAEVGLERLRVLDVDGEARGEEGVEGVEGYEADTGSRLDGRH